jgi:hypothetical protein
MQIEERTLAGVEVKILDKMAAIFALYNDEAVLIAGGNG